MLRLALLALLYPLVAIAADPIKVGVIGTDNYQVVEFTAMWHNPKATGDLAGLKVVAAYAGGSKDIPDNEKDAAKWAEALEKQGVKIVKSPEEVLKGCDAVLVMSADGRAHLEQLKPILKAGKPVYVGRPLAASLADVVEIFRLAAESKTPIFSCSQHRFSPGFIGMRNHPEVGDVLGADVYGGCPREPHHPDLFWHGVHGVETLYTILGPGCVSVTRTSTDAADVVVGEWKDGRVGTFRGILKGAVKYSGTVFGAKGVSITGVYGHGVPVKGVAPTDDKYMGYEPTAIEIAKFFKTGKPPVSGDETIELFAFMEAADESVRQKGAPVKLADVLAKAKKK